jgi:hypothetical protein
MVEIEEESKILDVLLEQVLSPSWRQQKVRKLLQ